jgi:lactoylglutathione lyase
MASQVAQFCISVTDLDRSEDYYTNVLGLQVQQRIEIPDAKELVLGSADSDGSIQLAQKTDQQGPIDHGDGALWKFYIYSDDIQSIYDAALAWGSECPTPPTRLDEWKVSIAFIIDPDGYRIELVQRDG